MPKIKREVGIDPDKTADDISRLNRADLLLLDQLVTTELNRRHIQASHEQRTRASDLDDVEIENNGGTNYTRF